MTQIYLYCTFNLSTFVDEPFTLFYIIKYAVGLIIYLKYEYVHVFVSTTRGAENIFSERAKFRKRALFFDEKTQILGYRANFY